MRKALLATITLAIAALACSSTSTPTSITPASTALLTSTLTVPPSARSFKMGVAGLVPRNFPNSADADWLNLYETLHETGELLGVYTNWADSPEAAGEIPNVVDVAFGLAPRYGFTLLVGLGLYRESPSGGLEPTIAWDDPSDVEKFKQVAVAIAHQYQPEYLALGGEVNRYYEHDPAGFERFITVYAEVYDAVKAASPKTLVFTVFQLEMTKGGAYLTGGSEARQTQWELLDRFSARLDLAAFTTYPFLDYGSPADIPEDYYAEIAAHTSLPVAFTEIGWPSAPLATDPTSAYGGSPEEQAAFVQRFFQLTADIDLALALWSFPHDLGSASPNIAMDAISLRHNDGTPKPALAVWQEMANKE
ncbi:MAG: hypothetical protein ACK2US_09525 [Anaerolineae bacterium]